MNIQEIAREIASAEYVPLKKLASYNVVIQYAAFLIITDLVIRSSDLDGKKEHSIVFQRAFTMIAPQGRESTDETAISCIKLARLLGFREYCNAYANVRNAIPLLFQTHSQLSKRILENEWKVPGQGVEDNMGATVKSIEATVRKEMEVVRSKWEVRLDKWRQLSLASYIKLCEEDKARVDFLVANPEATELPYTAEQEKQWAQVQDAYKKLGVVLEARQDFAITVNARKQVFETTQNNVTTIQETSKVQAAALEELEKKFLKKQSEYTQTLGRLHVWKKQLDHEKAKMDQYAEEMNAFHSHVFKAATAFLAQHGVYSN